MIAGAVLCRMGYANGALPSFSYCQWGLSCLFSLGLIKVVS